SELPDDYLVKVHGIATPLDLVARLFDKNGTFADLVRAGQGVVRDFLGIYKHAFFHGLRMETPVITADAVHTAAVEWLEVDKLTNLEPDLYDVLRRLVDEVVGGSGCPYFLLDRIQAGAPAIRALYDLRLIHLVRRGLTRADAPGTRYWLYVLDFGMYI